MKSKSSPDNAARNSIVDFLRKPDHLRFDIRNFRCRRVLKSVRQQEKVQQLDLVKIYISIYREVPYL